MRPVDIRDEVHAGSVMIGRQRPHGHGGAEIGTADADVDDVGEAAGAHALGEGEDIGARTLDIIARRRGRARRAAPCGAPPGPRSG